MSYLRLFIAVSLMLLIWGCADEDIYTDFHNPLENPEAGPPAGNAEGTSPIPAEAGLENVSDPDQVVGDGTPESCTCEMNGASLTPGVAAPTSTVGSMGAGPTANSRRSSNASSMARRRGLLRSLSLRILDFSRFVFFGR